MFAIKNNIENPIKTRPFVLKKSRKNDADNIMIKTTVPLTLFLLAKYFPLIFSGTKSPIQENQDGLAKLPIK